MHHRHAANRGLRGGQPARLGHEQVAGAHVPGHVVRKAQQGRVRQLPSFQLAVELTVRAADHYEFGVAPTCGGGGQRLDGALYAAASHAPAGDEYVLPAAAQPQPGASIPAALADGEGGGYRYAQRAELLPRDAVTGELVRQLRGRNDVRVALRLLRERYAHVVRRDVYHLRRLHAAAPDGGQYARREDVRGYNEVEAVLLQVFGHHRRHQPVRQVHGRAQGQLPVPLAQAVNRAEQPRSLLHVAYIRSVYAPGQLLAAKRIRVKYLRAVAAAAQLLRYRPCGGVMSAACPAGKQQDVQAGSPPFCPASLC